MSDQKTGDKWIPIFATGTHNGHSYDQKFLEEVVKAHSGSAEGAPLVIGHPKQGDNAPVYGRVAELKLVGNQLLMKAGKLVEQFKKAVNDGLYNRISVAFPMDKDKKPVPRLHHVGFLGSDEPALDLPAVTFAVGESDFEHIETAFEFAASDSNENTVSWLRKIYDAVTKNRKSEESENNQTFSQEDSMSTNGTPSPGGQPDKPVTPPETPKIDPAVLAAFNEKQEKDAIEIAALRKRLDQSDMAEFIKVLKEQGKVTPAMEAAGLNELLVHLKHQGSGDKNLVTFAKDGQEVKKSPFDLLKGVLESFPKVVHLGELAPGESGEMALFAVEKGETIDVGRAQLHSKVVAFRKEHPEMTYEQALSVVTTGDAK